MTPQLNRGLDPAGPAQLPLGRPPDAPSKGWRRGPFSPNPSNRWQAFGLVVFAAFLAELVSGSTPPLVWILPPVFLTFMALYGLSALVIRELAVRFKGGWVTIVLLGLAFGIVNEGMAAHSLFNPDWPGVNVLGTYGHWMGVSWLWAEWIVVFHAVWSIAFPIFLNGRWFPRSQDQRLLSDRWTLALAPVPIVSAVVASVFIANYPLTIGEWAGMFAAVAVISYLALTVGPMIRRISMAPSWTPSPRLAALGAIGLFAAGELGTWWTPTLGPYPQVGFLLLLGVYLAVAVLALTFNHSRAGERARFAFVLGGVGFFVALSPISEFGFGRFGLVPIDLVVLLLLIRLYRRRPDDGCMVEVLPALADPHFPAG